MDNIVKFETSSATLMLRENPSDMASTGSKVWPCSMTLTRYPNTIFNYNYKYDYTQLYVFSVIINLSYSVIFYFRFLMYLMAFYNKKKEIDPLHIFPKE